MRRKAPEELQRPSFRKGLTHTCKNCMQRGHNSNTCKNPRAPRAPAAPSAQTNGPNAYYAPPTAPSAQRTGHTASYAPPTAPSAQRTGHTASSAPPTAPSAQTTGHAASSAPPTAPSAQTTGHTASSAPSTASRTQTTGHTASPSLVVKSRTPRAPQFMRSGCSAPPPVSSQESMVVNTNAAQPSRVYQGRRNAALLGHEKEASSTVEAGACSTNPKRKRKVQISEVQNIKDRSKKKKMWKI